MKQKKILIVEDEEHIAQILASSLSRIGLHVLHAQNGEEALTTALAEHPDLILLDIMLPGMDGLAMLHALRKHEWGRDVPVILLTNLSPDDRVIKEIVHDEPSFYLIKANTSIEEIVTKIKTTLGL